MMIRYDVATWWRGVLELDESDRNGDETYEDVSRRCLRCVFCNRDLEDALRASAIANDGRSVAMLAHWRSEENNGVGTVFAAGLYCQGEGPCLLMADAVGYLGDMHAEMFCGTKAFDELAKRVIDIDKWEPSALRRMVIVCRALASLPSKSEVRKERSRDASLSG